MVHTSDSVPDAVGAFMQKCTGTAFPPLRIVLTGRIRGELLSYGYFS